MSRTNPSLEQLTQARRQEAHLSTSSGTRKPDLAVSHLVKPHMFATLNGELGVTFKLQGIPFDTQTDAVLNQYTQAWHGLISRLQPPYAVLTTLHRHRMPCDLKGEFSIPFAKEIDLAYNAQFSKAEQYSNDWYVTILMQGKQAKKKSLWKTLMNKTSQEERKAQFERQMSARLSAFELMLPLFKRTLAPYGAVLLGEGVQEGDVSPLLRYLGLVVNGGKLIDYRFSSKGYPIQTAGYVGGEAALSTYPHGHLGHFLPQTRITFAEAGTGLLQFHGNRPSEHRFGAMVSLKGYPNITHSVILDVLLQLDGEYISTQSFVPLIKHQATKKVKHQQTILVQSEDDGESQIKALTQLRDDLASENASSGYHHHCMMVMGDSVAQVYERVAAIQTALSENGIGMVREVLGLRPAFAAQLPGNFHRAFRASLITSHNFCDLNPLHNYRHGFIDGNHLGGAVTLAQTPSKTPYYFNYHSKGAKQNPSAGHSLYFGGNNSGKTAAMMHTATQLQRYGGRLFVFDRDRCSNITIWALGGHYTVLSPDHPKTCRYNPFALADKPSNREFLTDWFCALCRLDSDERLSANTRTNARRVIDYAYTHLSKAERTLSNACAILPATFEHFPALSRYLRETDTQDEGEYAYLFDNTDDTFLSYDIMGFDMTAFISGDKNKVHPAFEALAAYLFYRIEAPLNEGEKRLTSIFLDEFHQYLKQPYFQSRLGMWLPTLRKKNTHLVMATQSVATVVHSELVAELVNNTTTKNFFANAEAQYEEYAVLGCNEAETDTVKSLDPHEHFMLSVVKGIGSDIIRFPLAGQDDALAVYSANSATVALAEKMRQDYGTAPENWLPHFHQQRQRGHL